MRHFILIVLLGIGISALGQTAAERTKHFNLEKGLAIQGYDPVAYFDNKAVQGDKKFSTQYKGVTYFFSSEGNKSTFIKNPSKYEPQYGGWCAFAMGDTGKKVEVNPETFKIVDGKLYLFYNAYFTNTLKSWDRDENRLKAQANKHWTIINNK